MDKIKNEINNENIGPYCKIKMIENKRKKHIKHKTSYDCEICGFHHRKRTINEILRDLGERDNE